MQSSRPITEFPAASGVAGAIVSKGGTLLTFLRVDVPFLLPGSVAQRKAPVLNKPPLPGKRGAAWLEPKTATQTATSATPTATPRYPFFRRFQQEIPQRQVESTCVPLV